MSPVVPRSDLPEQVFAKDQPGYIPLPAHVGPDGTVTTRWRLSFIERLTVLIGGSIWLQVLTFDEPLQPVKLMVDCPIKSGDETDYVDEGI